MKTLALPEPAAETWLRARDVLTSLGTPERRWHVKIGGGTILAAHMRHRRSMDIDVVVTNKDVLPHEGLLAAGDLAARVNGKPVSKSPSQIKIEIGDGLIDLNTAPVVPGHGSLTREIAGKPQDILSNTQIMRGKLARGLDPAPVRDVYDIVRMGKEHRTAAELAAAYGLLTDYEKDEIENMLVTSDSMYESAAGIQLELTEPPCADMSQLGSTAARVLDGHRLKRLVVEVENGRLMVERTTRNGRIFRNAVDGKYPDESFGALGIHGFIEARGGTGAGVLRRALSETGQSEGVIFDTGDARPAERLNGRNPSRKRAPDLAPPDLR